MKYKILSFTQINHSLTYKLIVGKSFLPQWLFRPPEFLVFPVSDWFNAFFTFLLDTLHLKSVTRAIASVVQWLLNIVQNILLGGHKGLRLPALPWTAVSVYHYSDSLLLNGLEDGFIYSY